MKKIGLIRALTLTKKADKMSDHERTLLQVKFLNEYQLSMVDCYPTAMEVLADEQEQGRLNIKPAIIMTGREKLNDDVRKGDLRLWEEMKTLQFLKIQKDY